MNHVTHGLLTALVLLSVSARCAGELTIVAFGDSITAPRGKLVVYSDILRKELPNKGVAAKVVNAGIGGHTTTDARARFAEDVLKHKPDIVIIQFGGNDARVEVFRDPPASEPLVALPQFRKNLRHLIGTLKARGAKVVLVTTPRLRWTEELKKLYGKSPYKPNDPNGLDVILVKYAEAMREVARQQNVPLADARAAFDAYARQDGHSIDDLLLDGMHPNNQGQRLIADLLIPEILAATAKKGDDLRKALDKPDELK